MNYTIYPDKNRLQVFHEGKKRRIYVGELIYHSKKDYYEFIYNKKYINYKNAIPLGPELSLFKLHHYSEVGKIFPSFSDRLPSRENLAYEDYCESQGITPNEKNMIILLGTIGKRGPSSFIFEPVYQIEFNSSDIVNFRNKLKVTQYDLAQAFDINEVTLQRIEKDISRDQNTLKLIQIFLQFPEVALWQLKLTGGRIHKDVLLKLIKYFESQRKSYEI